MKILFCAVTMAVVTALFGGSAGCHALTAGAEVQAESAAANALVGTWKGTAGDSYAHQYVTLELRGDGTYTKTLSAAVGGSNYGGTHEGTWKANGMTVYLSGDGNWPPYSHDLSKFQKVR